METETNEQRAERLKQFTLEVLHKGFGGILRGSGQLVDRREYPFAMPIPENRTMKAPKPQKVFGCLGCSFEGEKLHKYCPECFAKWQKAQETSGAPDGLAGNGSI